MRAQKKNIKKTFKSAIILCVAMFLHINSTLCAQDKDPLSEENLRTQIGFLTDTLCQGRATGTAGSIEAAFWIQQQFDRIGLLKMGEGYAKNFMVREGLNGRNIIGFIPASANRYSDRYIIIGAHYDHRGIVAGHLYPGADSNASGVVAMLNIAEMCMNMKEQGKPCTTNLIFVAFDAKEHSMAGSEALWKMLCDGKIKNPLSDRAITKDKIAFMANIDQIGTTLAPVIKQRLNYMLVLGNHTLKLQSKRNVLETCNKQMEPNLELCFSYYGSDAFTKMFYRLSDQKIFVDNNIPALLFTSGITLNTNKTYDDKDTIDYEIFARRIRLIYKWLEVMVSTNN